MSSGGFTSPETRIYLHIDLHPLCDSSHPNWVPGAVCHPLPRWSRTSSRARNLDWRCPSCARPCRRRARPSRWVLLKKSSFSAVPIPAAVLGREGVGWARHVPEVFWIWHNRAPPPSLPPSICSLASRLPAPVPDVLSQAPRGSWKQKMLLPLATAQPACVPAGKS